MWSVLCLFTKKKYWMYSKKGIKKKKKSNKKKKAVKQEFFFFIIQRKHGNVVGCWNGSKGVFFKCLFSKQMENQDDYRQKTLPLQSCSYKHYDYVDKREKKNLFHTGVLVVYRKTLGLLWMFPFFGGWVTWFRNIWGGAAVVITWRHAPPPCEMGVAYRKSPYLWLWGLGAEKQLLQSWLYFVYWICCLFLFTFCLFFFFFLHSGFKYFFREKVCVSGGGQDKNSTGHFFLVPWNAWMRLLML